MNRSLTTTMKANYYPNLIARDGGFKCFYCKDDLKTILWVYDHLDDSLSHNNFENIVLSCKSCGEEKERNFDMKLLALEKKKQNEESMFVCERENVEIFAPSQSLEIETNLQNCEIAEQFLSEKIPIDGSLEYKDALDSITMICIRKTGHGSQVSVKRYLDALTSSVGPFMIIKNDQKKRIIVKRTGQ